jgi:N-acetylglucosaminyl-diphospho-decaprenol L-rhamnosyltransferase
MNEPLDSLTCVIVTYNSAHCLEQQSKALGQKVRAIIVDNGSRDNIVAQQEKYLPHANLILLGSNRGFGAANNIGLRECKTSWALLLNPDCLIDEANLHRLMGVASQYPDAAIIAPQVNRPNGDLEISYRWPSTAWSSVGPPAEGHCCVGFATGAALLVRLEAFERTGFFDEDFFLYYEDEDLCLRQFQAKHSIIVAPEVKVTHASRSSVKEGFPWRSEYIRGFHHAQSKLIFQAKHGNSVRIQALRMRVLLLAMLSLPLRLLWPHPRYIARLMGRINGLIVYRQRLKIGA